MCSKRTFIVIETGFTRTMVTWIALTSVQSRNTFFTDNINTLSIWIAVGSTGDAFVNVVAAWNTIYIDAVSMKPVTTFARVGAGSIYTVSMFIAIIIVVINAFINVSTSNGPFSESSTTYGLSCFISINTGAFIGPLSIGAN